MELLCSLFDGLVGVNELFGREEEKDTELSTLQASVQSISQSVRIFAANLPTEERDAAFHSNEVFPKLAATLEQCRQIVMKHQTNNTEEMKRLGNSEEGAKAALMNGIFKTRKTMKEGLELVSGKLGCVGAGFLPEDELEVMRKASGELTKLLPLLQLAISVYRTRPAKRGFDGDFLTPARPLQEPRRTSNSSSHSDTCKALVGDVDTSLIDSPPFECQLVSDHSAARNLPELPVLRAHEFRLNCSSSTASFDSNGGDTNSRRLVFGRQELRDRVPRQITLTPKPSEGTSAPQPLMRFVSRDLFVLEVAAQQKAEVEDSMNLATLAFGADDGENDATLSWGCEGTSHQPKAVAPKILASAHGLSSNGLHIRSSGQTRWRWLAKDQKEDVKEGDRVAILLESPPGSSNPGPPRDLEADEATCLLGIELRPPPPSV